MPSLIKQSYDFDCAAREANSQAALDAHFRDFLANLNVAHWRGWLADRPRDRTVVALFGRPPQLWMTHYLASGYTSHDAMLAAVIRTTAPQTWREVQAERRLSPQAKRLFGEAKEFGFGGGIAVRMPLDFGQIWGVAAYAETFDEHPETRFAFEAASRAYARQMSVFMTAARRAGRPNLTHRQRQMLQLLRRGERQSDIAARLKVGIKTVEATIAEARLRFGVSTTAELVGDALAYGEIDIF